MKRAVAAVVIVLVAAAGIVFLRNRNERDDAHVYVGSLLNSHSPEEAYKLFKDHYIHAPQDEAHLAAHVFGESLYAKTGVGGFTICDSAYGFGCFHTFIPSAIHDKGTSVIQAFDADCSKTFGAVSLGCFHGIGHGLMAYEGYTPEGLQESLKLCGTLSWKREYGGCREGAYMEYNFRTMIPSSSLRPFSIQDKFEPCQTLDAASRVSCYFSIPQWWGRAFNSDGAKYQKVAAFCDELKKTKEREACFRGVGYAAAIAVANNLDEAITHCDALNAASADTVDCREGVAWALYAVPETRTKATRACTKEMSLDEGQRCQREYLFVIQS